MAGKNNRKVCKIINETLARNKIEGKVGQIFLDEENTEKLTKAFNDFFGFYWGKDCDSITG